MGFELSIDRWKPSYRLVVMCICLTGFFLFCFRNSFGRNKCAKIAVQIVGFSANANEFMLYVYNLYKGTRTTKEKKKTSTPVQRTRRRRPSTDTTAVGQGGARATRAQANVVSKGYKKQCELQRSWFIEYFPTRRTDRHCYTANTRDCRVHRMNRPMPTDF